MKIVFALAIAGVATANIILPGLGPVIPDANMALGDAQPVGDIIADEWTETKNLGGDVAGPWKKNPSLLGEGGAGQWHKGKPQYHHKKKGYHTKGMLLGVDGAGQKLSGDKLKEKCIERVAKDIFGVMVVIKEIQSDVTAGSTEAIVTDAMKGMKLLNDLKKTMEQCATKMNSANMKHIYDARTCHKGLINASVDAMKVFQELKNVEQDNQFMLVTKLGSLLPLLKETQKLTAVCGVEEQGCVDDLIELGLSMFKVGEELQVAISTGNVEAIIAAIGDLAALYPLAQTVTSECNFGSAMINAYVSDEKVDEDCVEAVQSLVLDGESTVLEIAQAIKAKDQQAVAKILSTDVPKLILDINSVATKCEQKV